MREDHRSRITNNFGRATSNGLKILEMLYSRPFIDSNIVREKLNISFPTASDLIKRFVDADLLVEITGQDRYRVYQYFPYVRLFSESKP
jgi:DNA-binding MarR family transcriptional regulator